MRMSKTHWKKAFNKDFLGAHDLDEGQELKLTIDHVEVKEIPNHSGQKEKRNVAHFRQKVKPMILNATACKQISRFSGSYFIENWVGINIQVYVMENIKAFGEVTDALRIRDQQPRMEKPTLTPDHEKWAGAVKALPEKGIDTILKHFHITDENMEKLKHEAGISQRPAE